MQDDARYHYFARRANYIYITSVIVLGLYTRTWYIFCFVLQETALLHIVDQRVDYLGIICNAVLMLFLTLLVVFSPSLLLVFAEDIYLAIPCMVLGLLQFLFPHLVATGLFFFTSLGLCGVLLYYDGDRSNALRLFFPFTLALASVVL